MSGVRLVVFGRQGAGKGTQCAVLSEHYGAPHISTGDMLRAAVAEGSEVGRRAQSYMDAGKLLPDEVMLDVVRDRLAHDDVVEHGFLLDGFPRTVGQAEALLDMTTVDAAVDIDVPVEVVRERMLGRGRDDDTPEVIDQRLAAYEAETVPAIERFAAHGLLERVDGLGTPDEVTARLVAAIDGRVAGA